MEAEGRQRGGAGAGVCWGRRFTVEAATVLGGKNKICWRCSGAAALAWHEITCGAGGVHLLSSLMQACNKLLTRLLACSIRLALMQACKPW